MRFPKCRAVLVAVLFLALPSTAAWAHWCDDVWNSAYNISVRPDSDTSPKALYVENHLGYQLINFKLMATSSSGGSITLTPPTTLKLANTLLPGEKGIWKITGGNPAKVEDLTFSVTFGNTAAVHGEGPGSNLTKQYACYPLLGASPVMIVKNSGDLFPAAPAGLDNPQPNKANGCTYGDVPLGRSLQNQTIADWEDMNVGLDKILQLYCAGRGSWGNSDTTTKSYCKDTASTAACPAKATVVPGSRSDYMHLWGAGALAIRKGSLGARLPVFRDRLKCGVNDADTGIAGYTLFVLGYLGDDAGAKSTLQTQANASGDIGTIAKAALYVMGDTTQKAAVQAGAKSSTVFVKVACAAALGIVDKDDASVNSIIIPEVKWNEPDDMSGASDGGKGMYAAHMLELVAFNRRGWIYRGMANGAVTFYGETDTGAGGTSGTGGTSGAGGTSGGGGATASRDGGVDARSGTGGAVGSGGSSTAPGTASGSAGTTGASGGSPASGGLSSGVGGATNSGGQSASGGEKQTTKVSTVSGGVPSGSSASSSSGGNTAGSSSNHGGSSTSSVGNSGSTAGGGTASACGCKLGGRPDVPALFFPALAGLALLLVRRRRRNR